MDSLRRQRHYQDLSRRYGVDRYTAYEDLSAIGFSLPDFAPTVGAAATSAASPAPFRHPRALLDDGWFMIDGRPFFVAGYTSGCAPYGIYLDEMDDDYPTVMITPGKPDTGYPT